MFWHIFTNRCKCLVRDRALMFWTLMFPIILASLFGLAFHNLSAADRLSTINLAVVNSPEYKTDHVFQAALTAVSLNGSSPGKALFNTRACSRREAEDLLKSNRIAGYVFFQGGPRLVVRDSGLEQDIIKEFLDDYLQSSSTISTIAPHDPRAGHALLAQLMQGNNYIKEMSPARSAPDTTLNYYFALVAMACLYGSYWGLKEISDLQADLSPQGARVNVAPIKKVKLLSYSLCAASVIQLASILLLVVFLRWVLQVDFGHNLAYILLTCILGSILGILLGALIGLIIKKGEAVKMAVLVSTSMLLSFLAGLMVVEMKYIVTNAVPIMAWINPANLITDAFYSLYYYDTYGRFYTNIGAMLAFILVLYLLIICLVRRRDYASL